MRILGIAQHLPEFLDDTEVHMFSIFKLNLQDRRIYMNWGPVSNHRSAWDSFEQTRDAATFKGFRLEFIYDTRGDS